MDPPRILVAGIGNIFRGDDGFGVEVARRLMRRPALPGVRVLDSGTRGLDLALEILEGPDATILVDAAPRGGEPGTLYLIRPEADGTTSAFGAEFETAPDGHGMDPLAALGWIGRCGTTVRRLYLVACEPRVPQDEDEDERIGLSPPVEAAVDRAVAMVEDLVARLTAEIAAPAPA